MLYEVITVGNNTQNPILRWFIDSPANGNIVYAMVNALLVMAFTFFYTMMVFNPIELSNNMKKNGGFIPGIRPGRPTSEYITKVLFRITWFGALFLAVITIVPSIMQNLTNIGNIWFGGTSALIMVGVALETVKQIESQLLMRHYKGVITSYSIHYTKLYDCLFLFRHIHANSKEKMLIGFFES